MLRILVQPVVAGLTAASRSDVLVIVIAVGVGISVTAESEASSSSPSIDIQGSNPATINVGDTYTDLGAIVTDNQGHDLSYRTFINGALVSNIVINTSQAPER
jgi:hypothetical protein